ncbi:MAG: type I secretion system permease/ATPase [Rickettsiaceae bacterium]|nr:type I secretion system permease/ATPase [Rickettsiaceae bacterium]
MKQTLLTNSSEIKELNPIEAAIAKCKTAFWITFWFAFGVNMLMLLTPLYSLQVLDRVLGSGNMSTLLLLSLIIGFIYFVYGLLQVARSFTLIKIGEWLDNNVSPTLFSTSISLAAARYNISSSQLLRDFQTVKSFLTSTGINTLFDMPWTIAYIAVIFMIHPWIGYLTIIGGVIIIALALLNAIATNKVLSEATEYSIKGMNNADISSRNSEVIEAMGMMSNVAGQWRYFNKMALAKQSVASYRNGIISNISRFIRNLIQMGVTGISAYIIVDSNSAAMSTGGMIASSILVGKALAPFDNFIEIWKIINQALKSYKRINEVLKKRIVREQTMPLPNVIGHLTANQISYVAPAAPGDMAALLSPKYILKDVTFELQPGEVMAIIGPSAAGKSTLAKLITGIWKASSGVIRLNGGEVYEWNRENFGTHVGYLPQGIELFSGSIKENIARMSTEINADAVVAAAMMAGAHEMILKMQKGYDTDIGVAGSNLSGGQRQRIGLARAFYNNPKLVVLDEPNANLDEAGEKALASALKQAKDLGISVIVISHRPSVLSVVDKVLVIQNGSVAKLGTLSEINASIQLMDNGSIHFN